MNAILEQILLEADKVNINADPNVDANKGNKRNANNNTDYAQGADQEVDATGTNTPEDNGTDYTAEQPEAEEPQQEEPAPEEDNTTDYAAEQPEDNEEGGADNEEPPAEEDEGTDYGADQPEVDDGEAPPEDEGGDTGTDYTDGADGDNLDDGGEAGEDNEDDTGTDYTDGADDGGLDDDGTDDAAADDGGGDTGAGAPMGAGEETDDQIKERHLKVKNLLLLKSMIALFSNIKKYADIVTNMEKSNVIFSAIQTTVAKNFNKLYGLIHKYILYYYDHMSYEYNLYTYNYFIEAAKVNIEMISKIMDKTDIA